MGDRLDYKKIGERIKTARERAGLTQAELGDSIPEFGQSMVAKVEKGKSKITLEKLFKVSEALNCSVSYLLGIEVGSLSDEEIELLEIYRGIADEVPRQYAVKIMRTLAE